MAYVRIPNLEQFALEEVQGWITRRAQQLQRANKQLQAVIAYGPMVQHRSLDDLVIMEIVTPQDRAQTSDITAQLGIDPQVLGRATLVSISWDDFREAVRAKVPAVVLLLQGYRVLDDRGRLRVQHFLRHAG